MGMRGAMIDKRILGLEVRSLPFVPPCIDETMSVSQTSKDQEVTLD